MAHFRDATGRPGPATWDLGSYPDGQDEHPVAGVSWYEAAAYAKFAGKSLPTIYHWLAASGFMLAGEIMNVGGLSQRIVKLALTLVGHKRGGLGFVAILAACMLAALSGSAVADTAALAALLLPMMVKAGHDKARAGGLIASAGIIAPVIPPSIGFVVFGVAANVSISKLFLAGIVPGLLMGVAIAVTWYWVSQRENVTPPLSHGLSCGATGGRAVSGGWRSKAGLRGSKDPRLRGSFHYGWMTTRVPYVAKFQKYSASP